MTLTAEVKKTLDLNLDMMVLATKKLGVKKNDFNDRFEDIIKEVSRMQEETVTKILDNYKLKENSERVLCARVYLKSKLGNTISEVLNHTNH